MRDRIKSLSQRFVNSVSKPPPVERTLRNMNYLNFSMLFLGICMAAKGMKYIAIPIDNFDVIEVNPIVPQMQRNPRQTEAYVISNGHKNEPESQVPRTERSSSQIFDYVDFGSQTGANGAFSWYSDYPAHT